MLSDVTATQHSLEPADKGVESAALSLVSISKRYGDFVALQDLSIQIPQGEFLTLLGPSGSGKTTLLMIIAGFLPPTTGEIFSNGQRITPLPPEQRNFGMVFQGYALFPHLSVFDNVAFPLKVRGEKTKIIRQRVSQALDAVQMSDYAQRRPKALSGGQQQRVALARALVFEPKLLLLDEPLSALDKKLRADLQIELKQLHRRLGCTFICVTHDQEEALSMSDRIAVLNEGTIEQVGPPRDLYNEPNTRFVADFLGRSNFLWGQIVSASATYLKYTVAGVELVQVLKHPIKQSSGEVCVVVRPEKITLSANPLNGINTIEGKLKELTYYGSSFRSIVTHPILGDLMVETPAGEQEVQLELGQTVWLNWKADASVLVE